MYTGKRARLRPLQRALIMAASGEPGPIASWRGAATGSHICFVGEADRPNAEKPQYIHRVYRHKRGGQPHHENTMLLHA